MNFFYLHDKKANMVDVGDKKLVDFSTRPGPKTAFGFINLWLFSLF